MPYAKVAVADTAFCFDQAFDYQIPPAMIETAVPGVRVTVPFGAGNARRMGMILAVTETTDAKRVKKLTSVEDAEPLLDVELLSLVWMLQERTFCTLYEAVKAMLPSGLQYRIVASYAVNPDANPEKLAALSGDEAAFFAYLRKRGVFVKAPSVFKAIQRPQDLKLVERLLKDGLIVANKDAVRSLGDLTVRMLRLRPERPDVKTTAKQQMMMQVLETLGPTSVKELCYYTGLTPAVANALVKNGIADCFEQEVIHLPRYSDITPCRSEIRLTGEQQSAFDTLSGLAAGEKAAAALLYGVTGSGKTAVYLRVIDAVLDRGKSVLVMVPEIGLTPQTLALFCRRYGDRVAVFHSALSVRERLEEWKRVRKGEATIVVGTRSAVFAPLTNLGLIIIDEEQEHTYKSEQSPRYDAVEVAKFRAAHHNCLLLLASATPRVESFAAAESGRYTLCKLTDRYGSAELPEVVTVDMRHAETVPESRELSRTLLTALEENLTAGKQSILLINRRGYNTFAACEACGEVVTCPHCSISMTYHAANGRLMCHYCGYSVPFTGVCPQCGESAVRYAGFGTQHVEDSLARLLPQARIVRMDTDSTAGRNSHEQLLSAFANGEYDIMVGTQMVAKGLNFPNVTLVGVVSVDQQLYNDDYRALEKTFSLLTQVVGRSGRGASAGRAIIQTLTPENEIIRLAALQDYEAFYRTEIRLRKSLIYPPYCDLCVIGVTGAQETLVKAAAHNALDVVRQLTADAFSDQKLIVLGPMPARIAKISNKYRYRLILKCRNSRRLRAMIAQLLRTVGKDSRFADVTVYADINPDTAV
ncbi:MAG: primosomal protein N' [Clostridia bacterium]|nr:primosomal protein N' [Clostridia bacterium]